MDLKECSISSFYRYSNTYKHYEGSIDRSRRLSIERLVAVSAVEDDNGEWVMMTASVPLHIQLRSAPLPDKRNLYSASTLTASASRGSRPPLQFGSYILVEPIARATGRRKMAAVYQVVRLVR